MGIFNSELQVLLSMDLRVLRMPLLTVVSTAAPLQPKSSGPLSQPTEPVTCHLRSLLEPGWAGEVCPVGLFWVCF